MLDYLARRTLYTGVVLVCASFLVFVGLRIAPGDPTLTLLNPHADRELREAFREKLRLDEPVVAQYVFFLRDLFTGNFGESIGSGKAVTELLTTYGKNTMVLVGASALLTYAIAIPLGVIAAVKRGRWIDRGLMTIASLAMGIPSFILALVFILVFGSRLGWLPISGAGGVRHLILPVLALSAEGIGVSMRLMRSAMLEQLDRDYVRALRAKGLRRGVIVWRRALRNALIPMISLGGIQVGALVGYTAVVEIVFRWPGLGQLLVTSIVQRDYPVALWVALLFTAAVILANLAANIGYALADPRIRFSGQEGR